MNPIPIWAALVGSMSSAILAGTITGLVGAGKNAALMAQLRVEVNALNQNKDQFQQETGRHTTEIALLKQTTDRMEESLRRMEKMIDALPGNLVALLRRQDG